VHAMRWSHGWQWKAQRRTKKFWLLSLLFFTIFFFTRSPGLGKKNAARATGGG